MIGMRTAMEKNTSKHPNIKLFVTHSKGSKNYIVKNDIIQSFIQTDVSVIPAELCGKNIYANNSYGELTTQYWAWKNVDADYYGFFHYRRFLSFADKKFGVDAWSMVNKNYLNDKSVAELGLSDEEQIAKIVADNDIITPVPVDYKKTQFKSVYDHYEKAERLHIEDLDLMLELIKEHTPKYYDAAIKYIYGQKGYFCNIFVMKKALFEEYNEFLFTILKYFNQERDMSDYSTEAYRTPGHLGERMFGIFCTYIESLGKYRIAEREMVIFSHTKVQDELAPAFSQNNIPVMFATSTYYAQFCSAAIKSLVDNSSSNNNYDLIIIGKDFTTKDKNRLTSLIEGKDNFSIRFFDVGMFFDGYNLYESPTISIETYYRLVVPELFGQYDKILYLDSDLIVLEDVAKLYNTDIQDNFLGAVRDIGFQGNVNGGNKEFIKYYKQFECKDLNFFNAGVLIMNTKKIRENFTSRWLLDFAQQNSFKFQDQDLLNILFEGKIFELDYKWNFYGDPEGSYRMWFNGYAPKQYYKKYIDAKNNICIIHFPGNEKPWWDPKQEYAEIFWKYFRQTPYYEGFLYDRMNDIAYQRATGLIGSKALKTNGGASNKKMSGRFTWLLPKGTRRREIVKKIVCFFTGKPYIEPNYEAEGITPKYKTKQ